MPTDTPGAGISQTSIAQALAVFVTAAIGAAIVIWPAQKDQITALGGLALATLTALSIIKGWKVASVAAAEASKEIARIQAGSTAPPATIRADNVQVSGSAPV